MDESQEQKWIACTSVKWIYASEPALFEARRAIAHLARDWDHPATVDEVPSEEDLLHYIKKAQEVIGASEQALAEVVAEARHRGVSWSAIGQQLGIGATGAQKRFGGKGVDLDRRRALDLEARVAEAVQLACKDPILDRDEDVPPEQNFKYGASLILRTNHEMWNEFMPALAKAAEKTLQGGEFEFDETWLNPLEKCYRRIRVAIECMSVPRALKNINTEVDGRLLIAPCDDMQPELYVCYSLFHATLTLVHLDAAVRALVDPDGATVFFIRLQQAATHIREAGRAITRPECQIAHAVADARLGEADGPDEA